MKPSHLCCPRDAWQHFNNVVKRALSSEWEERAMDNGSVMAALLSPARGKNQIHDPQRQDAGVPHQPVFQGSFSLDFRRFHVARETHPAATSRANTLSPFSGRGAAATASATRSTQFASTSTATDLSSSAVERIRRQIF